MDRLFIIIFGLFLSIKAMAFPCFLTIVKDSCWTKYDVTVSAVNAGTGKDATSVTVPKSEKWKRVKFSCEPEEILTFKAVFSPVFWKSDEGKIYSSRRDWPFPDKIEKEASAWGVTLCYPKDFSEVPLPPDAVGNCVCDKSGIPPIPPQ